MRCKGQFSTISIGFITVIVMLIGIWSSGSIAYGEEQKKELPPRAISLAPEYTGVIVDQGDDVNIDLNIYNKGQQGENVNVAIESVPKGWQARIKTYSFGITGIHIPSDESKSLSLKLEQDDNLEPGKYMFQLKAETDDGRMSSSAKLTVQVNKKEKEKKVTGLEITTSYPVLQGPTDGKFEFSIDVKSKSDKDDLFNLSAKGPENWDINFKPAYEDKYISSLRIKADMSQSMAVEVKPYLFSEPGQYPIKVMVESSEAHGEVELMVVLTGTFKMEIGTADGLLSLNSYQGKPANISFYIKNTGSATQNNVKFMSFKPENWKVEFQPEMIESLPAGELKQVEATITPSDQALVGDYSVNLAVEGEKVSKNLELRVTVKASTAWGWVGIGIIVLVILGLVLMFVKLGRR